jgi:hypothetical protein
VVKGFAPPGSHFAAIVEPGERAVSLDVVSISVSQQAGLSWAISL